MKLNQFLRVSKPGALAPLKQREHLARGVDAESSLARFQARH